MKTALQLPRYLLWITIAASCSATTVIPVSVESLTETSSEIIEARALTSWPQWNPEHTIIFTYTRFEVMRTLKGPSMPEIVVKQMGGSADGYTQKVAGVRRWQAGEQSVLFLRSSDAADGSLVVTGLMQGNFRMSRAPDGEVVVSNGISGVIAYDRASKKISGYQGSRMTLGDLEQRIMKAERP